MASAAQPAPEVEDDLFETDADAEETEEEELEEGPPEEELPDFDSMKKAELTAWYRDHFEWVEEETADGQVPLGAEEFGKLKVAEQRTRLKHLFPDEDATDTPDVTGVSIDDPVDRTIAEVSSIKTPEAALKYAQAVSDDAEFDYFRLGAVLAKMQEHAWYSDDGIEDWKAMLGEHLGMRPQKALILVRTYLRVVECGLSGKDLKGLEWTKLRAISRHLEPKGARKLLARCKKLTRGQVIELAREMDGTARDGSGSGEGPSDASDFKSYNLKVPNDWTETVDEAMQKAMEDGNTDHPGTAFAYLCTSFLQDPPPPAKEVADQVEEEAPLADRLSALLTELREEAGSDNEAAESLLDGVEAVFGDDYPDAEFLIDFEPAEGGAED